MACIIEGVKQKGHKRRCCSSTRSVRLDLAYFRRRLFFQYIRESACACSLLGSSIDGHRFFGFSNFFRYLIRFFFFIFFYYCGMERIPSFGLGKDASPIGQIPASVDEERYGMAPIWTDAKAGSSFSWAWGSAGNLADSSDGEVVEQSDRVINQSISWGNGGTEKRDCMHAFTSSNSNLLY